MSVNSSDVIYYELRLDGVRSSLQVMAVENPEVHVTSRTNKGNVTLEIEVSLFQIENLVYC